MNGTEKIKRFTVTLIVVAISSLLIGAGSWIFLWGLEAATRLRVADPRYFFLAPVVGLVTGVLFTKVSQRSSHGNILVVSLLRHHSERALKVIPRAMAPLIVFATWISHLCGASVGREGTAVQMGAGLAATLGRLFRVEDAKQSQLILKTGVAAGFGSVFGVPIAGAVFANEVGRERSYRDFFWCVLASVAADLFARTLGAHHAQYEPFSERLVSRTLVSLLLLGVFSGLLAWLFLLLLHRMKILWASWIEKDWLRPTIAGFILMWMAFAPFALQRYAGLGATIIEDVVKGQEASFIDPFAKILFTVFAIATGFRGGEVTPLFFIGATAGSAIAWSLGAHAPILAGVGLVTVFGAAAGTPLACAVMAGELFGPVGLAYALPVCFLANFICRASRLYDAKPEL